MNATRTDRAWINRGGLVRVGIVAVAVLALASTGIVPQPQAAAPVQPEPLSSMRFEAVDVYVDSGDVPLAAYQIEVRADTESADARSRVKLVGVEGGEKGAFEEPPRYDPTVLRARGGGERIILAAYSLRENGQLPKGLTRVARLHVQVPTTGLLGYFSVLTVAGDSMANEIPATVRAKVSEPPVMAAPAAK
jgi:hypothetical protein